MPGYVLILALFCAACSPQPNDIRYEFFALGTDVSLTLYAVTPQQAGAAAELLESYYADAGRHWYPWAPGELQSINAALASGSKITVSARLADVIRRAAEIEAVSNGRFNAGLGLLTELWGLDDVSNSPDAIPSDADIAALLAQNPGTRRLLWDGNRVSSESTSVKIDLGGIAKGALLDDGIALLRRQGINNAIINLGGDLTVIGSVHERRARVGIRSPAADSPIAFLDAASGETIVTSGNYERFVEIGGRRYTHILDPSSGFPVTHTVSVTVVHEDALLADAAATAMMVGGADEFEALCKALDIDYAVLIDASGDMHLTSGMRGRLHSVRDGHLTRRTRERLHSISDRRLTGGTRERLHTIAYKPLFN
ncbi:MAG: FAD:protein FMN transferase [Woeseiaceae bacterium]